MDNSDLCRVAAWTEADSPKFREQSLARCKPAGAFLRLVIGVAVEIELFGGEKALVDDLDAPAVMALRWYKTSDGYATAAGKYALMHRFILGLKKFDQIQVDHRDGNKLNNRRENLRVCSAAENARNRKIHKNNRSGLKGVYFEKSTASHGGRPWRAQIRVDGRKITLGRFDDAESAHLAYLAASKMYHGEFARN